jgi:hypothetical protein
MDHLFEDAPSSRIADPRPNRKVVISELAPDAQDFEAFGVVAVD